MYRKKNTVQRVFSHGSDAEKKRGVVLLIALTVSSLVLTIGAGILMIVSKQAILSSLAKNSQIALFVADSGVECATHWDMVKNVDLKRNSPSGSGNYPESIFATTTDAMNAFNGGTVYGGVLITDTRFNPFCAGLDAEDVFGLSSGSDDYLNTYFSISIPVTQDGSNITTKFVFFPGGTAGDNEPCALVSVTRTIGDTAVSIFSEGFSSCGGNTDRRVSRGIRVDYTN